MTRSLESEVRIRTNIPKFALKTRGGRLRSNVAYAHNAGGRSIQGGFAAHGETDLRPTCPPGLAPARRAVLLGWFHKIGGPGQAAARAACYSAAARLRSPTHAILRLSPSTLPTFSATPPP